LIYLFLYNSDYKYLSEILRVDLAIFYYLLFLFSYSLVFFFGNISFSHIIILYGSTYKRISEYTNSKFCSQYKTNSVSIYTSQYGNRCQQQLHQRKVQLSSKVSLRSTLVFSAVSSIPYYERMEIKNDLPNKDIVDSIDSSQLLYKNNNNIGNFVSKITNIDPTEIQ